MRVRNHKLVTALALALAVAGSAAAYDERREKRVSGGEAFAEGYEKHGDGDYDQAIAAFERAAAAGYREEVALYNIACGYALKGERDRAFTYLERAIAEGFDSYDTLRTDDDLDSLHADPRWREVAGKLRAARAEENRAEAEEALRELERLEKSGSRDGEDFFSAGHELHSLDRYPEAARAWQRAAELGYRAGTSSFNVACALALAGSTREALDWLGRSVEAGFSSPDQIRDDDDLDSLRGEPAYAAALRVAESLELPPMFRSRSKKHWSEAAWRSSLARAEEHLRQNPSSGHAWSNIGHAQLVLDNPAEARAAFSRALDLGFRPDVTTYNIACAHARLGQKDLALEWLGKAEQAGFDSFSHAAHDEDLESLRSDPRFQELVREHDKHGWEEWGESMKQWKHEFKKEMKKLKRELKEHHEDDQD